MSLVATMDHGPVHPGKETWAKPRRMSASDGNYYVVKIRNGDGSRSFFNEFVGSKLARIVGLSAIEPVVINLNASLIEKSQGLKDSRIKPGQYYATKYFDGAYTASEEPGFMIKSTSIVNLDEVPSFVIFDIFVNNKDRHGGNVILIPSDGGPSYRYLLIDHGHCFGGPMWGPNEASNLPYELAGVPWYTGGITGEDDFRDSANRVAGLGEDDIDAARDGLPDAWDVPDSDYGMLKNTMLTRKPDMMLAVVRSGRASFTGWKKIDGGRGA